jgi:hypothetical protein
LQLASTCLDVTGRRGAYNYRQETRLAGHAHRGTTWAPDNDLARLARKDSSPRIVHGRHPANHHIKLVR